VGAARAGEVAELAARPDLAAVAERPDVLARAGVLLEALRGATRGTTRGTTPRGQARRSLQMPERVRVGWLGWLGSRLITYRCGQVDRRLTRVQSVPLQACRQD